MECSDLPGSALYLKKKKSFLGYWTSVTNGFCMGEYVR